MLRQFIKMWCEISALLTIKKAIKPDVNLMLYIGTLIFLIEARNAASTIKENEGVHVG